MNVSGQQLQFDLDALTGLLGQLEDRRHHSRRDGAARLHVALIRHGLDETALIPAAANRARAGHAKQQPPPGGQLTDEELQARLATPNLSPTELRSLPRIVEARHAEYRPGKVGWSNELRTLHRRLDQHADEDATAALTYLASLAEACGVERVADLGDLPPFPELRRRVARGDLPPYR